jgi:tetratricopeptide (TPR) repeat protein
MARQAGVGTWRTRLRLARALERSACAQLALKELALAFDTAPAETRCEIATEAGWLAIRAGAIEAARDWVGRAAACSPEDYAAQARVVDLSWAVCARAGTTTWAHDAYPVESAAAADDWQAAYDAVMRMPLDHPLSLARLVNLARRVRELGDSTAALDVLGRGLDLNPTTPEFYWLLVQTLTDLGRYEDANAAVAVLDVLELKKVA